MPITTWSDEYSVNVREIDVQHQKMLELVNDLHSAVEACIDKNGLKSLLVELLEFTR
ncbi:MAG: hemerythrin, partial [Gammaproteobacteria bacterium]|nr:hemerythrin [Gammaproteobacteria bacterium]